MPLRLPRWLRRTPAPQGRHVRTAAPVTVPGAAGALVSATVEPFLVAEAATGPVAPAPPPGPLPHAPVPAVDLRPAEPDAVTAGDVGLVTEPLPPQLPGAPVDPASQAPPAVPGAVPEPTVALGFADGGVLALAPDDPRLAGFQDAAAAVLGHERA